MDILNLTLKAFYLLIPVYLANMSATLSSKCRYFDFLSQPIDANRKFGKNYILGPGKTWRGLIVGTVLALIIVFIQTYLYNQEAFRNISLIDYSQINFLILGLISGLGALMGDIVASFGKRRLGLERGAFLPFIDQWDFITSYFILLGLITYISWNAIIIAYLLTLIIHPLSNIIGYFLKVKKVWW